MFFVALHESGSGTFRPIAAVQQYVRSRMKSRHGADIADRLRLTRYEPGMCGAIDDLLQKGQRTR